MTELLDRIRACHPTISQIFSAGGSPGLSIGILHQGNIIQTAHFGTIDVTKQEAPNDETIYRIASLTKAITASTVAILVGEGTLDWDRPIREYLPDFGETRKDAIGQEATLRDLLSNRTGLARSDNSWGQQYSEHVLSKKEMFRMTRHLGSVRKFRSGFAYNQWNYVLVTEIIESVTGKSMEAVMSEKLLKPLKMERTTFGVPSGTNVAKAHAVKNNDTAVRLPFVDAMDEANHGLAAASACKSSVKDLLTFYKSLMSAYNHQKENNVDTTPGSPFRQLRTVMTPHIALGRAKIEDEAYCFGLNRIRLPRGFGTSLNSVILGPLKTPMPIIGQNSKGTDVFFHNGTFPGHVASFFLIPSSESAVVVLSNSTPFMDATDFIGQHLVSILLGEEPPANIAKLSEEAKAVSISTYAKLAAQLEKGKTGKAPQHPLESYEGSYWNAAHNIVLHIAIPPSGLGLRMTLQNLPLTHYDLLPYDGDTFYWRADRDGELEKGMWPITSIARHKVAFSSSGDGKEIDTLAWHHDPVGKLEIFRKLGSRSFEKSRL